MVRVELYCTPQHRRIATVEADEHGLRIDGPLCELIDPGAPLLGLPSGRRVSAQDAPQEWARGLLVRFRSPDLLAQIVHDDEPLPAEGTAVTLLAGATS